MGTRSAQQSDCRGDDQLGQVSLSVAHAALKSEASGPSAGTHWGLNRLRLLGGMRSTPVAPGNFDCPNQYLRFRLMIDQVDTLAERFAPTLRRE
jgi:hypothetical protein